MLRIFLRGLLRLLYRIEVQGLEHYTQAGPRVVIVVNHLSFLDALLVALFLPEKPMFAVNKFVAERWYFKPFLSLVKAFALDPGNPLATKNIIQEIKKDQKCVIFPEGRITVTGSLMKIYEGPGLIADKAAATLLPLRIEGAQYSPFSRLKNKVRIRWFPKITLRILAPHQLTVIENIKGRPRRQLIALKLYDLMSEMLFQGADYKKTLFKSLIDQMHLHGSKHLIVEDLQRKPLNYRQFLSRSFIIGKKIAKDTVKGDYVGMLLPNMVSSIITFFALHAYGRVPVMLNFSAGAFNVVSACTTAQLKIVYTSVQFIQTAKLMPLISALEEKGIKIVYLEELAKSFSLGDKLYGLAKSYFPSLAYKAYKPAPTAPAVILFTSGSEGTPKGVVLSHLNIQANRYQLASRVDFGPTDIVFNALPIFHAFGLTGGTLLPLLSGIRTFFYPSPLHYRIIPELIYETNATIMFGTDNFLAGYARFAHPYDFYSIRYVFAGAEKLKDTTRILWSEKYGIRIFEGYGATETAPVLSINTPMHNKPGTVGRLLPGINYELVPIAGIEKGHKLVVTGPNIMQGYLLASQPGVLVPPTHQHYDTGDIVNMDAEGFITIAGRVKRFAKVAGEMVSLTAVETYLAHLWKDFQHAVISIADAKKGEALVLFTTHPAANREEMMNYAKQHGITELAVPRLVQLLNDLPLLGTGKVDYVALQRLLEANGDSQDDDKKP